jgi:hypothetical protein
VARPPHQEDAHRSALQTFVPLMVAGSHASVRCPHCEGEFQVDGKRWRQPLYSAVRPGLEIEGRACPYCLKVSLIPLDFFPKKLRAVKAALRG